MASRAANPARAHRPGTARGLAILTELLQIERGLTAIIGGGGKTTLLHSLAQECAGKGKVVVATSTKMLVPDWCTVLIDPSGEELASALGKQGVICVGSIHEPSGKLAAPNAGDASFEALVEAADYVLVEADGSRYLPMKAHAAHEPVIPSCANQTITVVGIDCLDRPVSETCHRPEIFAKLAGASIEDAVTPEMVARVLNAEALGQRVYVNKVESDEDLLHARQIASQLDCPVVAGSLKKGEFQCLQ